MVSTTLVFPSNGIHDLVHRYLDAHVQGGYAFLVQNWRMGDKICIFGMSSSNAVAIIAFLFSTA